MALSESQCSWMVNYDVCYKNDILFPGAYFNGTLRYHYTLNDHRSYATLELT